jgi:putative tryptophan/tyrosine transport system substrate-binding protein
VWINVTAHPTAEWIAQQITEAFPWNESYGSNIADTHRLVGLYAGRILKGDKPADLPVQQATKVEMYTNLKTASALGITITLPLSGRADEIFE